MRKFGSQNAMCTSYWKQTFFVVVFVFVFILFFFFVFVFVFCFVLVFCCLALQHLFIISFQALKRIVDRDGIPEDRALQRIESQISNQARVDQANVVLCTLWEPDVTQKQVWSKLTARREPSTFRYIVGKIDMHILSQWAWFSLSTRSFIGSDQNSAHPLL